jgi:hypothetical protein
MATRKSSGRPRLDVSLRSSSASDAFAGYRRKGIVWRVRVYVDTIADKTLAALSQKPVMDQKWPVFIDT